MDLFLKQYIFKYSIYECITKYNIFLRLIQYTNCYHAELDYWYGYSHS